VASRKIAVVGGTGPQGKGLAYRFAAAGHEVRVGSRDASRATEIAASIAEHAGAPVEGGTNNDVAQAADIVVLTVPYDGHAELVPALEPSLRGKIVVSCVNPLGFDAKGPYALDVADGSAAEELARIVPKAQVVGAFHHVSALTLWRHKGPLEDEDVLVCGDHEDANAVVASLATSVTGRDGIIAGGLRLARELEPWTAVLIGINKRHKVRSGIRITGL
jgi:NADPH-dependent F420 reductase